MQKFLIYSIWVISEILLQYHNHKLTADFLIYLLSGLTEAEADRPEEDFRFRHEEHRTPLSGLEMSRQGPASGLDRKEELTWTGLIVDPDVEIWTQKCSTSSTCLNNLAKIFRIKRKLYTVLYIFFCRSQLFFCY